MNIQDATSQAILRKSNLAIFVLAYLAATIPLASIILSPENHMMSEQKVLVLCVIFLVAAPFVAFWAVMFRLTIEYRIREKDIWGLLMLSPAPKGSLGNPDLSSLFGEKGKKILRRSFRAFIALAVLVVVSGMLFNK